MPASSVRSVPPGSTPVDAAGSPHRLADLRRRVARLERSGTTGTEDAVALGIAAIDAALPAGGLVAGAVHEVLGDGAAAFAVLVAARTGGPVLWCLDIGRREEPYGPGLAALGLDPDRLVLVRCRGHKELLWAMEEGLRSPAPAAVVAEPEADVGLIESRRLQLAAEAGGTLGLILREGGTEEGRLAPSAVTSRWQVDAAPGGGWRIVLRRCRGGSLDRSDWKVERHDATGDLALAAAPGDRPAAAGGLGRV